MIKANVEIGNKSWHRKIKKPNTYLNKKLKKIIKFINFFKRKEITFTILLTDSLKMKKLNKKFRNINKSTDVLSFPFFQSGKLKLIKNKKIYLGDIAVSYEIVRDRAKKTNFAKEFDKVWVHGILHLIGHRHKKNKEYLKMNKIEKKILNSFHSQ